MTKEATQTYNVATIAKLLMLTERRVQQLAKDGFIPKAARGQYELVGSVQGYLRFLKSQLEDADFDIDLDSSSGSSKHKNRLLKARADKAELELMEMRGQLARVDVVADTVAKEFSTVRANLSNVPSKCANKLLNSDNYAYIVSVIEEEIAGSLRELIPDQNENNKDEEQQINK